MTARLLKAQGKTLHECIDAGLAAADFSRTLVRIWYRDTFGDGWNSGTISFKDTNTNTTIITLTGPASGPKNWFYTDVLFSNGTNYTVTKVDGFWPSEIKYAVTTTDTVAYLGTATAISTTDVNCILAEQTDALRYLFTIPSRYYYSVAELKLLFTAADLKAGGFTPTQLKIDFTLAELNLLFTVAELKDGGFTVAELKLLFTLAELIAGGLTVAELKIDFTLAELKLLFTLAQLKDGGFTAAELVVSAFTILDIVTARIPFNIKKYTLLHELANTTITYDVNLSSTTLVTDTDDKISSINLSNYNFYRLNYNTGQYTKYTNLYIYTNGYLLFVNDANTYTFGKNPNLPTDSIRYLSFDSRSTIKYYISNSNLFISAVGSDYYNTTNTIFDIVIKITQSGVFSVYYKSVGGGSYNPIIGLVGNDSSVATDDIFYSTFDGVQAFNPGNIHGKYLQFNLTNLVTDIQGYLSQGLTVSQLIDGGFQETELKGAGVTATQFKTSGFSAQKLKNIGFLLAELKTAFTVAELKLLFTVAELKLLFTLAELKAGGFTAAELKAGGFTTTELFNSGFTSKTLFENNIDIFVMEATNQTQILDLCDNANVKKISITQNITFNKSTKITVTSNKIVINTSNKSITLEAKS